MHPRLWLLTTVATVIVTGAAMVAVNRAVDIYGIYHPAAGRRLAVFGDARVAKYLLSMRYVPENFNAVLAGPSVSSNWDVTAIRKLRVYNESLNAANMIELKALIEAALERPGISVAMLVIHPALTNSHEFRTTDLTPALKRSALGSVALGEAYKDIGNIFLKRMPQSFSYAGVETFFGQPTEMNTHMKAMWNAPEFVVDPNALAAQKELITKLRARGVRLVFIVPPVSENLLRTKADQVNAYVRRMRADIDPGDVLIDFLTPEYAQLRRPANFCDGVHLTSAGAREVVASIDAALDCRVSVARPCMADSVETAKRTHSIRADERAGARQ